MSNLSLPAILTILVVVLLVLVVLVALTVRGRRAGQDAAGAGSEQGEPAAEASSPASADAPQDPGAQGPGSASADTAAPADPETSADPGTSADPAPVDDDPRPWRERHGRRASRPLLSERSADKSAETGAAASAPDGESSPGEATESRR